mgnify:CR=1 FL=1
MVNHMSKSICIITTIDLTLRQFVIPSAREMQKNGFIVSLLSSMEQDFIEEYSNEFKLINIPFERGANFLGMLRGIIVLFRIFRKEKFQIIQFATPNASFYASIAGFLNKVPARLYCQWGIRYVGFKGTNRIIFKLIEKITCLLSTHIRPASRKNMEFAISEGLYKYNKAKVIGAGGAVGIDLTQFDINKKAKFKAEVINDHPYLKNKTIFGFVGRLDKDKGVNELLKAFKDLYTKNKDTALIVVGPKDKPSEISSELLAFSYSCDNVLFTGYSNEVARYLSCFDILVHPSYREGFSLVIQQAMAMGVPVITTDIPGPSEVIEKDISGLLVRSKDSTELYHAMNNLLTSDKKKLFAENGLKRVKDLFTQENMSRLIVEDRIQVLESVKK